MTQEFLNNLNDFIGTQLLQPLQSFKNRLAFLGQARPSGTLCAHIFEFTQLLGHRSAGNLLIRKESGHRFRHHGPAILSRVLLEQVQKMPLSTRQTSFIGQDVSRMQR